MMKTYLIESLFPIHDEDYSVRMLIDDEIYEFEFTPSAQARLNINLAQVEAIRHGKLIHVRAEQARLQDLLRDLDKKIASKSPPAVAETLFELLAPETTVESQLGDMQELFESHAERYGRARAQRFYWVQVLRAIAPSAWRALTKWGFIGALVEFGRRKLGL
jgi:hypothetical protein